MPATGRGLRKKEKTMVHIPVLLQEVIESLSPKPGGFYLDCTVGDGGHSEAILESSAPNGRVVSIDADSQQVEVAKQRLERFGDRVRVLESRFSDIDQVATKVGISDFDGILFDLGYSSRQLHDAKYGLSYADESTLDMRLGTAGQMSAADWLNRANEVEIGDALFLYGDRHSSRSLARKIIAHRRKQMFRQAKDLKAALGIERASELAPIWQTLRIVVNDEYGEISLAIPKAIELLAPGGVLAVITFHSGEDRVVKRLLAASNELVGKQKLILPTFTEIKKNSRARSAKLRVVTKK